MVVKVFILGRPGSGKSTSAQYLTKFAENKGWSTLHVNDYEILLEMCYADTEQKFLRTDYNGFDVLDFSVLDVALKKVQEKVRAYIDRSLRKKELVLIEFARGNYCQALKVFDFDFLRDSYFLFLDADLDICLQRIHQRVTHHVTEDDHPSLSDDAFRGYYGEDNRDYIYYRLKKEYHISKSVEIIDNSSSLESFKGKVNHFANLLFSREDLNWDKAYLKRELFSRRSYSLVSACP